MLDPDWTRRRPVFLHGSSYFIVSRFEFKNNRNIPGEHVGLVVERQTLNQVQCVKKYVPKEPDELALEESDVVNVFKKLEDGMIFFCYKTRRNVSLNVMLRLGIA